MTAGPPCHDLVAITVGEEAGWLTARRSFGVELQHGQVAVVGQHALRRRRWAFRGYTGARWPPHPRHNSAGQFSFTVDVRESNSDALDAGRCG